MWEALGDVNPLVHDGAWVRKVAENEYNVVRVFALGTRWIVEDLTVNVTDSWIDTESVNSFADNPEGSGLALACVEYYGAVNFGSYGDTYCNTEEETSRWLGYRGIEV